MPKSASTPGGKRASTPRPERASPSPPVRTPRSAGLPRTVEHWLGDGKAQGWSPRTLGDRRHMMNHFLWWLEYEEEAPLTLDALAPPLIRSFLIYVRAANPTGRWASDLNILLSLYVI